MRVTPSILTRIVLYALVIPTLGAATGKSERSRSARAEFQRGHPCPANGAARGPCPGYVVDHVIPLCTDGPDRPENMQWQYLADAKEKDALERTQC